MNEPYQRVSENNSVFDGAFIGAAIAAGGAGAGVFGARMSYNGIDKKAERLTKKIDSDESFIRGKMERDTNKYNSQMERKSNPNIFERNKYNKAQDEISSIVQSTNNRIDTANRDRQDWKQKNRTLAVSDVEKSFDKSFSGYNMGEERHHNRNSHVQMTNKIDSVFDEKIDDIRRNGANQLKYSPARATVGEIDDKIANRQNKVQDRYDRKMSGHNENLFKLNEQRTNIDPDKMRKSHAYSKMGGWRNAGIIGASAVLGFGAGAITDHLAN